jgi:cell division protein FtsB
VADRRLVVTSHEPGRRQRVFVITAVLALVAAWALFAAGQRAGGYRQGVASDTRSLLEEELAQTQADNERLRRELAELRTAEEVDTEARQLLQASLTDLQSQVAELNGELDFYRDIMGPAEGREGLQIRSVDMDPVPGSEGWWRVQVVLTQVRKHDRRATGSLSMMIEGRQDEETLRLNVEDLTDGDAKLVYGFRYFQTIERDIAVPDGFRPQRLVVTLKPREKGADPITGSYEWSTPET